MLPKVQAVQWFNHQCVLIDQTRLPREEVFLKFSDYRDVTEAIRTLTVRGAPAIGIAGAYAAVLAWKNALTVDPRVKVQGDVEPVRDPAHAGTRKITAERAVPRDRSTHGRAASSAVRRVGRASRARAR